MMNHAFVPSVVASEPPSFPWHGRDEHTGSTRYETPLLQRLDLKTSCAYITLCAGIVMWGALRLEGFREEHKTALQLAEAAMAYQVDWRYADRDAVDISIPEDGPPEVAALYELCIFLWRCIDRERYWDNYYSPMLETFHAAHLARHMLPRAARAAYGKWLARIIDRLDAIAPKPDEDFADPDDFATDEEWQAFASRHRGNALPPEVLDPGIAIDPGRCRPLVERFLSQLDWTRNPFLRSPQEMQKIGFTGTPYTLAKTDS